MPPAPDVGHGISFVVRWRNFRVFHDTDWIALKPLTLLLGSNSSGKSSFLAPLLLLKQSIRSRTGTNGLLTRGEYLDVGAFGDFVRGHVMSDEVTFSLRWHSHSPDIDIAAPGSYPPGGMTLTFGPGDETQSVVLSAYRVEDTFRRHMLSRVRQDNGRYTINMISTPAATARGESFERPDVQRRTAMRQAIIRAQPKNFLFSSLEVRRAGQRPPSADDPPSFPTTIDDARTRLYCSITDHTEWAVRSILDRLYYIGPLREEPRRVYELSGEMPPDVGTRGEYAPEIVYRWRNDKKRLRDVRKWLSHFGFQDALDFKAVGTGGFSLVMNRDGAPVASTFVDTGFGMSQVLPLVVQGLLANEGDWIAIEQPEIHLNPRLQAGLADLLANIVHRGVGLIIESHSEHLLLRLRRLVAEQRISGDDVALYFVEPAGYQSRIRQVGIDRFGFIDPRAWPNEFFEDALRESMALAQAQVRERRRETRERRRGERAEGSSNGDGDAR